MLLATEALKGGDATNASAGFGRAGAQQSVNMMLERGAGSMPFLGMHVVAWSSGSHDGTATDDSETTGDNFNLPGSPTSVDAEPILANALTFALDAVSGQCGLIGCLHCASDYQNFATAADRAAAIDLWHTRFAECVASRAIAYGLAEYIGCGVGSADLTGADMLGTNSEISHVAGEKTADTAPPTAPKHTHGPIVRTHMHEMCA